MMNTKSRLDEANFSAFIKNSILWFKFVLESQVLECSMESFLHKDYRS